MNARISPIIFFVFTILYAGVGHAEPLLAIRFGGDHQFPPFEYADETHRATGFNVDLAYALGKVLKRQVIYEVGDWTEMREKLAKGELDILNGYRTTTREQIYDHSIPHTVFYHVMVTKKPGLKLDDLGSLKGLRVLVSKNTATEDSIRESMIPLELTTTNSEVEALRTLTSGNFDVAVVTKSVAESLLNPKNLNTLMISGSPIFPFDYCFVTSKGKNSQLLNDLNQGLTLLRANGTIAGLRTKWFPEEDKVSVEKILIWSAIVLTPIAIFIMLGFSWNLALKKQVNKQTKELKLRLSQIEQVKTEIAEKNSLLRAVIDGTTDIIAAKDHNMRFILANKAFMHFLNLPEDKILGRLGKDLTPGPLSQEFAALDRDALESKGPVERIVQYGSKTLHVQKAPIELSKRTSAGVIITGRDITSQKEHEELKDRLLRNEADARETAERLSTAKNSFLLTLSHELRTPMSVIVGWVDLLRARSDLPEDTYKHLDTIHRNAKYELQLITDLLDITAIESGHIRLNFGVHDPKKIIITAADSVQAAATAAGVKIAISLPKALPKITCDDHRLQQIMWNLLTNSLKFTSRGGTITISAETQALKLLIKVKDDGVGISSEFLASMFDRFTQEDSRLNRKFQGLGVGLALTKNLVELHRGTIAAASAGKDLGAEFTIELPLENKTLATPKGVAVPQSAGQPDLHQVDLTGRRVLIIDDFIDYVEALEQSLKIRGATVKTSVAPKEFLGFVQSWKPDVLIIDIGMPDMDGYTLLGKVRDLESNGTIPAIALTAFAGERDVELALAAGFQLHIAKPASPTTIATAIYSLTRTVV